MSPASDPYPEPQVEGGLVARLARFFPNRPIDLRPRSEPLPEDGKALSTELKTLADDFDLLARPRGTHH